MATLILRNTHRALEQEIKSLEKEKRDTSVRIREAAEQGDLKKMLNTTLLESIKVY